jgi:hypothetical protein
LTDRLADVVQNLIAPELDTPRMIQPKLKPIAGTYLSNTADNMPSFWPRFVNEDLARDGCFAQEHVDCHRLLRIIANAVGTPRADERQG